MMLIYKNQHITILIELISPEETALSPKTNVQTNTHHARHDDYCNSNDDIIFT